MIIKLRQRRNKIANANPAMNDEWVLFDNATDVKFGQRPEVTDLNGFKHLKRKGVDQAATKTWTMLKDPSECDPTETYHYNVVSYRDRITNERHEIIFDTIVFLMTDQGTTLQKIEG